MRMEEHAAGGRYVVRAELPGVDPAKDMEVSVAKGLLTIRAERHEDMQGQYRSEFRYGTFTRHIALPVTADAKDIKANYHWGILQVSIGLHGEEDGHPIRWTFNEIRRNSFIWRGETCSKDGSWSLEAEFRLKRIA